jgi:hypothetical protein
LHNVAGSVNYSAGGFNTHGCKYISAGNPTGDQACFFYLPMGQVMGTDCTHEDLMFTNNNTGASVTTYGLLLGPASGGTLATELRGFKFDHCYFELHGKTIGAFVADNTTTDAVHMYVLFEEGTYNIGSDPNASWQMWNNKNSNWNTASSNGISGFATHYGHRAGINPLTANVNGTLVTGTYQVETIDPNGFLA